MNKREIQRRLNLFYEEQYQQNYGQFSFFGNLFRYWFGWYQEPRLNALQTYLKTLGDNDAVPLERLKGILVEPIAGETASESESAPLIDPINSFAKQLIAAASLSVDSRADLGVFPTHPANPSLSTQITLGDLHGNAIKLIYFLVREGVLQALTRENYARLIEIYSKPVETITAEDLANFNGILDELGARPIGRVRLIGDVLCDRGMNDYYTLRVLATLKRLGVPVEIEASNHDIGFLSAYNIDATTAETMFADASFGPGQGRSMSSLQALLSRFPDEIARVKSEIETAYLPSVTVLNYSLSPDGQQITLYTHAPVNLITIQQLARNFGVEYKAGLARELAGTIDRINAAVKERGGIAAVYEFATRNTKNWRKLRQDETELNNAYIAILNRIKELYPELHNQILERGLQNDVEALLTELNQINKDLTTFLPSLRTEIKAYRKAQDAYQEAYTIFTTSDTATTANPLYEIIWNRPERGFALPSHVGPDSIHFVYGHVGPGTRLAENTTNLDSSFGKANESASISTGIAPLGSLGETAGAYLIHTTEDISPYPAIIPMTLTVTSPSGGSPLPSAILTHASPAESVATPAAASAPLPITAKETEEQHRLYLRAHPYALRHSPTDIAAGGDPIHGSADDSADADRTEERKFGEG